MQRRSFLQMMGGAAAAPTLLRGAGERPNVVVILADDIGYGDLSCYGAKAVRTPNLDRLAQRGVRFTDAHSSSATCTPTRYSLLTGQYAWRKKGTGIARGDANLLIDTDRPTLASVMKSAGYATGAVGKWHLGLGKGPIDWNGRVAPGPNEIGFDYSFLIPATGDRTPCVYLENGRVVGLDPKDPIQVNYDRKIGNDPTGKENPELLKMGLTHGHDMTIVNGISRIGWMTGGKSARWVDEDMADTITGKAVSFIEKQKRNPFFLYFATHDIHVPRVPHARFKGKAACGTRCDVLLEFDDTVGKVMAALDRAGIADNTLLVVTSDNGPVLDDGYADGAVKDLGSHTPAGVLKGGKYSLYEGGTRMPFLARWPKRITPGVSDALIGQWDLMASLAALTGQKLSAGAGPDSQNVLPALLGESKTGRDHLVEHANGLALRKGTWKLIPAGAAGVQSGDLQKKAGRARQAELYDLSKDLGETTNLASQHPAIVQEMTAMLQQLSAGKPE
ncbi:MAG: arylsulfatase [Bryobacter sp.]|nr:arylsulfatase [Bryobacter sp.]